MCCSISTIVVLIFICSSLAVPEMMSLSHRHPPSSNREIQSACRAMICSARGSHSPALAGTEMSTAKTSISQQHTWGLTESSPQRGSSAEAHAAFCRHCQEQPWWNETQIHPSFLQGYTGKTKSFGSPPHTEVPDEQQPVEIITL